jgi:hypothetical protein
MGPPLTARAIRTAPLRLGAGADAVFRRQAETRSLPAKVAAGLLAAGVAALLAKVVGADVRAGFGAGQPDLVHQTIRGVLSRPTSLG